MQNIYDTWTQFNKKQAEFFKGPKAEKWLEQIQSLSSRWNKEDYPRGENWKYVKFNELPQTSLALPESGGQLQQLADEDFVVIEVSDFATPQSIEHAQLPNGLTISTHMEEMSEESSPLYSLFSKNDETNPFAQSALSFSGLGMVIRVSEDANLEKPIKFIFDLDQVEGSNAHTPYNVMVICGEQSKSQFFVETRAKDFSGFSNLRFDISVKEKATTHFYIKENGSNLSSHIFNLYSDVERDGLFRSFDFTLPGQWTRHNINVNLNQPGATAELKGAYLNHSKNFSDHHTVINHHVGQTYSVEDYRGILSDQAQAVFNGKVYIAEKAAKSNSDQINKNLMLSKKAEIDTKPELRIFNDDVKAAHGATVGQLDEEQRFYLQSRGYSAEQARKVLARAFVFDLIDEEDHLVKKFYEKDLMETLSQLKEG